MFFLNREKVQVKKEFSTKFLGDLGMILAKCFATTKKKKENFITQERLELDFLKLLQNQKKFKNPVIVQEELVNLAAYDMVDNIIGRIININLLEKKVELVNLANLRRENKISVRSFNEVEFFDYTSMKFQIYFEKQQRFFDNITYKETYCFLGTKEKFLTDEKAIKIEKPAQFTSGGGIKLGGRLDKTSDIKDN